MLHCRISYPKSCYFFFRSNFSTLARNKSPQKRLISTTIQRYYSTSPSIVYWSLPVLTPWNTHHMQECEYHPLWRSCYYIASSSANEASIIPSRRAVWYWRIFRRFVPGVGSIQPFATYENWSHWNTWSAWPASLLLNLTDYAFTHLMPRYFKRTHAEKRRSNRQIKHTLEFWPLANFENLSQK